METREWTRRDALRQGAAIVGTLNGFAQGARAMNAGPPPIIDAYETYDGLGLADLISRREVSAEELLDIAIERTETINPRINAVVLKYYELAREQIEAGLPDGPFTGVPFLLKDLGLDLLGARTTSGSRSSVGLPAATADSTLVSRYKQAGLVIFGKTATPEFGLTATTESKLHGLTRNPWDLELTAGGSSGGAAAAVIAGLVPMAHASDGGGSIRTPASCCGVFGMKPTRARTPMGPDYLEAWQGLSTNHVVTMSVRDSAALMDISHGPEPGSPYRAPPPRRPYLQEVERSPGRLRIALVKSPPSGSEVSEVCLKGAEETARLCESLGHEVEEAQPLLDFEAINKGMLDTLGVSVQQRLEDVGAARGKPVTEEEVEPVTWLFAEQGKTVSGSDYARARSVFDKAGQTMDRFMESCDVILSPTLAKPPVRLGLLSLSPLDFDAYVEDVTTFGPFTAIYNQTGQPSMSVPLCESEAGLPIGMMFSGRFGDEATLYRLAGQLERAKPWRDRRPSF